MCDTFVALPPATADGSILFGKNSDREPNEAQSLEVKDHYAISNGLTIGAEFDRSHPDLVATAREKSWLKKGATFNFAECYSDWFFTTFSACRRRQSRSEELLGRYADRI